MFALAIRPLVVYLWSVYLLPTCVVSPADLHMHQVYRNVGRQDVDLDLQRVAKGRSVVWSLTAHLHLRGVVGIYNVVAGSTGITCRSAFLVDVRSPHVDVHCRQTTL